MRKSIRLNLELCLVEKILHTGRTVLELQTKRNQIKNSNVMVMRIIQWLFILVFIILISCKEDKTSEKMEPLTICFPECSSIKDTITTIMLDYLKYVNSKNLVYQIFIEQRPDSTSIFLSYAQVREELERFQPVGYFRLNDNLFLVYSGISYIIDIDSTITSKIKSEIESKGLLNLSSKSIILYDNLFWEIVISNGGKNIAVISRRIHKYGLPRPPSPPMK